MKVPGTENLEILVWVNACTNEVQHCRQIVAINTVILKENPDNETSTSSGKLAARDVAWEAKEDLEQEPQSLMKIIWSIVPGARDLPHAVDTSFSKKTAFLTRQSGKREDDRPLSWGEDMKCMTIESPNQIEGLTPCQIPGKLTSRTKKDTEFLGKKDRR